MPTRSLSQEFSKGLWVDNPVTRQLLGMCSTLAITNAIINGVAMGLAVSFVLIFSSLLVSLVRKFVPNQVRIATYIVIIASFVTIADRFMSAFFPPMSKALGPYVPLIVVNCIILGRAEAFASKSGVGRSVVDAFGMSAGYIAALLLLSAVREVLGSGTLLGYKIMGSWFEPWTIMILPPGAFITLGILMAFAFQIERRAKNRR
ncbi:MAG: electron transport complex subunit E [Acidobacteriota bacterium]